MDDLSPRLRAVCDLDVAEVREYCGRHEYDGLVQDLSPEGVRTGLARLADAASNGDVLDDPHDETHLAAFEDRAQVVYGELELHRSNPLLHLSGLDLACYDREYAPQDSRDRARAEHLANWPDAIDAALASLDRVNKPVASALVGGIRGLAAGIPAGIPPAIADAALAAHARLVDHVQQAADSGDPDPALGPSGLSALLGSAERMEVDLVLLAEQAETERDRLRELLANSCARIDPARPALDVARELVRDHPDADGVLAAARRWTERAIAFCQERDLVPYHDGECRVGLAPESPRWAMAMMSPAAPGEPEGPSWYHITPPDPSWPEREQEEWLAGDLDLGSASPAWLAGGKILAVGKRGTAYLLNARHLAGVAAPLAQAAVCSAFGGMAVRGTVAYVPCISGGMAAVDTAGGRIRVLWRGPAGAQGSPVAGGGAVWVTDWDSGVLYQLDPATGRVTHQISLAAPLPHFASPSLSGRLALVGTISGVVAVSGA